MKAKNLVLGGVLISFSLLTGYVSADGWWQKGVDVLKSVGSTNTDSTAGEQALDALSADDIGSAFKQALSIGSENVVKQLGAVDGFNSDPTIHIPLPEQIESVKSILAKVGMSQIVDDLELKLNRAAEAATPKAKALFLSSIQEMSFDDVLQIYNGPENSATEYFKEKMSVSLGDEMRPIVDKSLADVGAIKAFDQVMGQYQTLPFVPDVKANLTEHVVNKGMDGIFFYLAQEEAAIRKDPVKQSTDLLKRVFGTQN